MQVDSDNQTNASISQIGCIIQQISEISIFRDGQNSKEKVQIQKKTQNSKFDFQKFLLRFNIQKVQQQHKHLEEKLILEKIQSAIKISKIQTHLSYGQALQESQKKVTQQCLKITEDQNRLLTKQMDQKRQSYGIKQLLEEIYITINNTKQDDSEKDLYEQLYYLTNNFLHKLNELKNKPQEKQSLKLVSNESLIKQDKDQEVKLQSERLQIRNQEPLVQTQHKEPLPQTQHKEPLPQTQHKEPLLQTQHKEPLPQTQHKEPLPQVQDQERLPQVQDQEPLPQVQDQEPLPQVQDEERLPLYAADDPQITYISQEFQFDSSSQGQEGQFEQYQYQHNQNSIIGKQNQIFDNQAICLDQLSEMIRLTKIQDKNIPKKQLLWHNTLYRNNKAYYKLRKTNRR